MVQGFNTRVISVTAQKKNLALVGVKVIELIANSVTAKTSVIPYFP